MVIGAIYKTVGIKTLEGAAYAFTRGGTVWSLQQELTATDGAVNDYFGSAVSLSGGTAVVGAIYKAVNGNANQGAAYVFVNPNIASSTLAISHIGNFTQGQNGAVYSISVFNGSGVRPPAVQFR